MNDYLDKLRTIGVVGKHAGKPRVSVTRAEKATVIETEHWSGRQDATVRPDTVRFKARTHDKTGEIAEVEPMAPRQAKERYGNQ